ncbi:MAG: alpha/beta fold hydrolase [Rhizomicrobium sp.]
MPHLNANGISLAYDDVGPPGAERCIILIHGFASNRNENWRRVGWCGAFERRHIRAVAFDVRGHGESEKPHAVEAYAVPVLVADIFAIMDALGIGSAALMGYSMGARLALSAALLRPERCDLLVLGGVGGRLFDPPSSGNPMADAMEKQSAEDITEPFLRSFRQFADAQGEDRLALAACARARGTSFQPGALSELRAPTLVVAGARDSLAGDPEELAAAIPAARAATLPGCDHFSAIAHLLHKAAVFDFFDEMPI